MDQVICPAAGAPDSTRPARAGEAWEAYASGLAAAAGATAALAAPATASSRPPARTRPRMELRREREMFISAVGPFTTGSVSRGLSGRMMVPEGAGGSQRLPLPVWHVPACYPLRSGGNTGHGQRAGVRACRSGGRDVQRQVRP